MKNRAPRTGKVEREYGRALRKIARHVADIVGGYPPADPAAEPAIRDALTKYASIIDGWARFTAGKFVAAIAKQNETEWIARSQLMGRELRREILNAPTGQEMRRILASQVELIKSIPLREAERVHRLTQAATVSGERARQTAAEIMRSNDVTAARALLIARTETSRASSALTEARAKHVGSDGYIFRTSNDSDVRESHREMNGKFVRWDAPPTLDGLTGHAGALPNCRCYCDPVLPE